jgi:hypothetical protein
MNRDKIEMKIRVEIESQNGRRKWRAEIESGNRGWK